MKTLLVPGWMKSVSYYGEFEGIDVWKNSFVLDDFRSAEYVVAHSMGAAYALGEDKIGNDKTKYILINPVMKKISLGEWIWRWLRFVFRGGARTDRNMGIRDLISAIKRAIVVTRFDLDRILEKMFKENVIIIRGSRDDYFCDRRMSDTAKRYGFQVVEADGLGHEWDNKYRDILKGLIV